MPRRLGLIASALEVLPDSADAWSNRGVTLKTLERWGEALESYDRALVAEPDHVDALINRGHALLKLGRFEEALASCDKALAINPNHPVALNNRGHALIELKRATEALAVFERAQRLNPDDLNIMPASVGRCKSSEGSISRWRATTRFWRAIQIMWKR